MNKPQDPPRLFNAASDTTDGVRAVLRSGKRELPAAGDLARLAARLPLGPLPPPSGASPSPPLAPPSLAAVAAPSVIPGAIVGALLALGVVGGMAWRDAVEAPAKALSSPAAPASAIAIEAPGPARAPAPDPRVDLHDPARSRVAPPHSPRSDPPSDARAAAPRDDVAIAPPSDAPAPSASPPSAAAVPDTETEAHLLQRAQNALGANPSAALALTGEHARRFASGALAQESEFIAVSALLALGRTSEARGRAASLLERFPSSAYRGRLESLGLGNAFQKNEPASPRTQ